MDYALLVIGLLALAAIWDTAKRVGRVERKLNALLKQQGIDLTPVSALSERVRLLADDPARKIEAIKVQREETGAGLAEAKKAVEDYIESK